MIFSDRPKIHQNFDRGKNAEGRRLRRRFQAERGRQPGSTGKLKKEKERLRFLNFSFQSNPRK